MDTERSIASTVRRKKEKKRIHDNMLFNHRCYLVIELLYPSWRGGSAAQCVDDNDDDDAVECMHSLKLMA